MKTLGDRFRFARKRAKLTQEQLGKLIGISKSAVSQIESGTTESLAASTSIGAERATGVSGRWIVTGKGDCIVGPPITAEDAEQIERIYGELIKLPSEYREKIEKEIEFFSTLSSPPK